MVEQLTLNQWAQGSSPWRCTNIKKADLIEVGLYFLNFAFIVLRVYDFAFVSGVFPFKFPLYNGKTNGIFVGLGFDVFISMFPNVFKNVFFAKIGQKYVRECVWERIQKRIFGPKQGKMRWRMRLGTYSKTHFRLKSGKNALENMFGNVSGNAFCPPPPKNYGKKYGLSHSFYHRNALKTSKTMAKHMAEAIVFTILSASRVLQPTTQRRSFNAARDPKKQRNKKPPLKLKRRQLLFG